MKQLTTGSLVLPQTYCMRRGSSQTNDTDCFLLLILEKMWLLLIYRVLMCVHEQLFWLLARVQVVHAIFRRLTAFLTET